VIFFGFTIKICLRKLTSKLKNKFFFRKLETLNLNLNILNKIW